MRMIAMILITATVLAGGASAAMVTMTCTPAHPIGEQPWQIDAACSSDGGGLAKLQFTVIDNSTASNIAPAWFETRTATELPGWPSGDYEILCAMNPAHPDYGVGQSGAVAIAQGTGMCTLWSEPWRVTEAWVWASPGSNQMVPAELDWQGFGVFVPEPATILVLAAGIAGLALKRARRRT